MKQFAHAYSQNPDWDLAVNECLEQIGEITSDCSLGFIYFTDKHAAHSGDILRKLKQATSIDDWVGTIGMAVCFSGKEFYDQPAIVMLITDLSKQHYRTFNTPEKLPELKAGDGVKVAIVHGDPRNSQLPKILHELPDKIGNGFLAGGLTSSDSFYYQIANELDEGSVSGVSDSVNGSIT